MGQVEIQLDRVGGNVEIGSDKGKEMRRKKERMQHLEHAKSGLAATLRNAMFQMLGTATTT